MVKCSSNRTFNESHAITQEIKYSESSRQAIWYMVEQYQNGSYQDGKTINFYVPMAPDRGVGNIESARRHLNALVASPATFYRGGMTFSMTKYGNNIQVRVTDAYSVSSMITRNSADDIHRIRGKTSPLRTTNVNFTWEGVNFEAKKKMNK